MKACTQELYKTNLVCYCERVQIENTVYRTVFGYWTSCSIDIMYSIINLYETRDICTRINPWGYFSLHFKSKFFYLFQQLSMDYTLQHPFQILPVARAGPNFQACMRSGKFQGIIWPHTPMGSWRVYAKCGPSVGMVRPWILSAHPAK